VAPFVPLTSLSTVPNPVIPKDPSTGAKTLRPDLGDYIADLPSAIQLGKALFWDMQAGSDNTVACASCHYHAGADRRTKNQFEPGMNRQWEGKGPNRRVDVSDFPLTDIFTSPVTDSDNTFGSQGIRSSTFLGVNSKNGAEMTRAASDSVFGVNGATVRQVTKKNTPSIINAVFNHRQFYDGRAQLEFNGVNGHGYRDPSARVWALDGSGYPVSIDIKIMGAGLASQAVMAALNTGEMSAVGRTFPDLGVKLLMAKPLGLQVVSPTDSVLGTLAVANAKDRKLKGLKVTYGSLIQKAFKPRWWNASKNVVVKGKSYTMMQANFSLFWGLAIMMYEATLVSDDTPMDRYLASRVFTKPPTATTIEYNHIPTELNPVVARMKTLGATVTVEGILDGLALFELPVAAAPSFPVRTDPSTGMAVSGVGCIACHFGSETTVASIRNLTGFGLEPDRAAFGMAGFDLRMERMFQRLDWTPPGALSAVPQGTDAIRFDTATYGVEVVGMNGVPADPVLPLPVVVYDAGWYNIGVRPMEEDPGVGGLDPFGKPLSWTHYFQKTLSYPGSIKVPSGGGLASGCVPPSAPAGTAFQGEVVNPLTGLPILAGPLLKSEATSVMGTFKTPSLRNVELTAPYFHNGGKLTLAQVVDFYHQGGDFEGASKSPLVVPLRLTRDKRANLVAFMVSLTDERVLYQRAPFDHPQLFVADGATDSDPARDELVEIPAVGKAGGAALPRFLDTKPF